VIAATAQSAKVILAGKLDKKVRLVGVAATKGARAAIEAVGGSIEEAPKA
jgi:large subunit ribosomal protein L15